MKLISHRGNINGPDEVNQNEPLHIEKIINSGVNCEVDVWKVFDCFFLGHDFPKYKVRKSFLKKKGLWCHAKNLDALQSMLEIGVHCFWHQNDNYTLTSEGYIWTFPNKMTSEKSIIVHKDANWRSEDYQCFGVCSDYIL